MIRRGDYSWENQYTYADLISSQGRLVTPELNKDTVVHAARRRVKGREVKWDVPLIFMQMYFFLIFYLVKKKNGNFLPSEMLIVRSCNYFSRIQCFFKYEIKKEEIIIRFCSKFYLICNNEHFLITFNISIFKIILSFYIIIKIKIIIYSRN